MAEIHERDTYVVKERDGGSGVWVFGIIVVALAALGVWYFVSSTPTTTVPMDEPAATSTMDPAVPATPETTAPTTITPDSTAPAAPAPTDAPAIDAAPAAPEAPATPAPAN